MTSRLHDLYFRRIQSIKPSQERQSHCSDVSPGHPLVHHLLAACRAEGVDARVEGMTAWVDAALLVQAGIPAVCFGPGSIGKAHSADEFVPVSEIHSAAAVLARFTEGVLRG